MPPLSAFMVIVRLNQRRIINDMTAMSIHLHLAGGDLRSIGRADEVAALAMKDELVLNSLCEGLEHRDRLVRMRCADALEKATRLSPQLLSGRASRLLHIAVSAIDKEMRWHLAQILPRLVLTAAERRHATAILLNYLDDASRIVQVCALEGLCDLAITRQDRAKMADMLVRKSQDGAPSVRARARKLLKRPEIAKPPAR